MHRPESVSLQGGLTVKGWIFSATFLDDLRWRGSVTVFRNRNAIDREFPIPRKPAGRRRTASRLHDFLV